MVDSVYTPSSYSQSLQRNETRPGGSGDGGDGTVISARFSSQNILTVHLAADKLLSECWAKACEFARNFNALHIDIDHLLLGASHVRDAEAALAIACDDIEELTHELARLCARRSFAQVPAENAAYEASQSLRIILCEASALAARQGVPNLTLSLVIEALARTEPRPAVIEVLPKIRRRIEEENAGESEAMKLLSDLHGKVNGLSTSFDGELRAKLGALDAYVGQAIAGNLAAMEERLQLAIGQRVEDAVRLTHQQSEETKNKVYEAVRVLPNMVANMVGERVTQAEAQRPEPDQEHPRRWFHFWRT